MFLSFLIKKQLRPESEISSPCLPLKSLLEQEIKKEDIHVSAFASPINNNKDRPGCDIVPPLFWLQQKNIVAFITTSVAESKKCDEFRAWNKSKFEPSTTWKNRAMVRAQAKA